MRAKSVRNRFAKLTVVLAALAAWACATGTAHAQIQVTAFDGAVTANQQGDAYTQAGGHPHVAETTFRVAHAPDPLSFNLLFPLQSIKDVEVSLPPGLVGNPTIGDRCAMSQLFVHVRFCPFDSQVGVVEFPNPTTAPLRVPLFNMVPNDGSPAQFGFEYQGVPTIIDFSVRTGGDYGIDVTVRNANHGQPPFGSRVIVWGDPSDSRHDEDRGMSSVNPLAACTGIAGPSCANRWTDAQQPLMTNPTACTAPGQGLVTQLRINSWEHPEAFATPSFESHLPPGHPLPPEQWGPPQGPTGCDRVPFDPSISVRPTTSTAGATTGLEVDLSVPQDGLVNSSGIASAHLKDASVTLPEGMAINPASADGLGACDDTALGLRDAGPDRCPDASKIGTVEVRTPLLDEALPGAVYLRSQASDDPASGDMFRLALVVDSRERGVRVKLGGQVRVDPATGQLRATFEDNPQIPFSQMKLRFKQGPRAPLSMPTSCGRHEVEAELTSWARPDESVARNDGFTIPCPADRGLAPGLAAGTELPIAGAFSPFVLAVSRDDSDRELSTLDVELPQGLLGRVAGVPLCEPAAADTGLCPSGSRIGAVEVAAGAGPNPLWVPQAGKDPTAVYLSGPYRGAPYSLSIVVPAQAGPFDLGRAVVRAPLNVDRRTAKLSTTMAESRLFGVSGTLERVIPGAMPTILKGVPLQVREIRVSIDRPGFTINPTDCDAMRIDAVAGASDGARAALSDRFQVGECAALPFQPRLGLRLTGRRQVRTGRHPGVRAVVRQTGIGEAGVGRARVVLPSSLALDPENAQALCEFADGTRPDLEDHCPKGSIVGRARAKTPLLDKDLVGDVYFVKNVERHPRTGNLIRKLPMIVVALRGEIAINLYGKSDSTRGGRLVNTFADVPDAPITRFNLNIDGGDNGILAVTRTRKARINLCANPRGHTASTAMRGHNGKRRDFDLAVKTPCAKASKAKRGDRAKR